MVIHGSRCMARSAGRCKSCHGSTTVRMLESAAWRWSRVESRSMSPVILFREAMRRKAGTVVAHPVDISFTKGLSGWERLPNVPVRREYKRRIVADDKFFLVGGGCQYRQRDPKTLRTPTVWHSIFRNCSLTGISTGNARTPRLRGESRVKRTISVL